MTAEPTTAAAPAPVGALSGAPVGSAAGRRPASTTSMAGHNRITTQALESTARAVAAELLGAEPGQIKASFSDDRGLLALMLVLPLPVPSLTRVLAKPAVVGAHGGSLRGRAEAARTPILERVQHLTGARLSRVDIRITGSTVTEGARPR